MTDAAGREVPDPRYINLCVEAVGLAPIPVETVIETARQRYEARRAA